MHIHCSGSTAELLIQGGIESWVTEREDLAYMKGKASVKTFWVVPQFRSRSNSVSSYGSSVGSSSDVSESRCLYEESAGNAVVKCYRSDRARIKRLIEWNVEVLYDLLVNLVAHRRTFTFENEVEPVLEKRQRGSIVVDELVTILDMPDFDKDWNKRTAEDPTLPHDIRNQLRSYVWRIADTYRNDVPFHNFFHASHVILSASKLLKRVVEPDNVDYRTNGAAEMIHKCTYGISSDPLMRFTVVFSALLHDAGHTGISNAVAINDPLSQKYHERSVAEQRSVDLGWKILNEPQFKDLRACIYTNKAELNRFRQLLVNAVSCKLFLVCFVPHSCYDP